MGGGDRPVWGIEDGVVYDGPFRSNVGAFVDQYGSQLLLGCCSLRAWTVDVLDPRQESAPPVQLYVYEDIATAEDPPVCDQCRIIGERQHPHLPCSVKFPAKEWIIGAKSH